MRDEGQPPQLWIRTEKAQVFGPLSPISVELLLDNGIVTGRVQVSLDGSNYVFPGRLPGVRMVFPRELWGESVEPGDAQDAAWRQAVLPPPLQPAVAPVAASTAGPPAAPRSGPGVRTESVATGPASGRPGGVAPARGPVLSPVPPRAPPTTRPPAPPPAVQPPRPPGAAPRPGIAPPLSSPSAVSAPRSSAPQPAVSFFDAAPAEAPTPPEPAPFASAAPAPPPVSRPSVLAMGGPPAAGDLARVGPMRLYALAASSDATGLLTLTLADRALQVHFKKGAPEFIDSTHPEDALAAFLLGQGLATPQQLGLAEAQKARFGGELLPALFGLGLLNPNAAFQQVAARSTAILFRALAAERGSFTFASQELPSTRALPLGNRWSLYLEQLRRVPPPDVLRRMQGLMPLPVLRSTGVVGAEELKLQPQEARSLTFFDGVHSLNELIAEHPMEADVVVRTAWMVHAVGVVSFAGTPLPTLPPADALSESPPPQLRPAVVSATFGAAPPGPPVMMSAPRVPSAGPSLAGVPLGPVQAPVRSTVPYPESKARPPSPPPAAPVPQAVPHVSSPSVARVAPPAPAASTDVAELQALLQKLKGSSYLEVLGVTREADPSAVKAAYFRLAKNLHPDTVLAGSPPALSAVKADLFALVGEANRTLSDPALRAEYLAELDSGGKGEKVDIGQLLLAEELFQRGRNLVKARKYAEAVKVLDEAIVANAQEGEYFGWRGYARFFTETDKGRGHFLALRDIDLGLKMNPNAASVYYFNGFLWKLMGDATKARSNFRRCVELDPRHVDAQRELRMAK